jgi:hypothetical protein
MVAKVLAMPMMMPTIVLAKERRIHVLQAGIARSNIENVDGVSFGRWFQSQPKTNTQT